MSAQAIVPKADHTNKEIGNCECGSSFGGSVGCDVDSKYNLNNGSMEGVHENSVDGEQGSCLPNSKNVKLIFKSQEQAIKASFGHEQKPEKSYHVQEVEFQQGKDSVIATVAWMIICGDGFHNFIDGVSIGAAFQESILTGISISLAVLCEELPHELGDFAVLINSGMTMKQALFYNFLSATTCYIGMGVGIAIGEFTQDSTYIFALAAGMFLYISLVDMLPEMNETATKAAECSVRDSIQVLILQNLGMFLGVFILFVLAYFQDRISLG
ncbi:Zinc transporter ZIP10 [Armadillidium vulgare]|nr:Zinc transporter ZIP10 [Armadillidium vulgare]RXG58751.1 Zinc transporter ZIP10 [Armadillidium vulgare]